MRIFCGYICVHVWVCWKILDLWCIICGCALYIGIYGANFWENKYQWFQWLIQYFGQGGGATEFWPQGGPELKNLLKIGVFPLKLHEKKKKNQIGGKGAQGTPGSAGGFSALDAYWSVVIATGRWDHRMQFEEGAWCSIATHFLGRISHVFLYYNFSWVFIWIFFTFFFLDFTRNGTI